MKLLVYLSIVTTSAISQPSLIDGRKVKARDGFQLGNKTVTSISDDSTFASNSNNKLVTESAVKKYADNISSSYVSVKRFGAKGDGVTNDAIAIQAAVNSGLCIFFPKGDYRINSNITLPDSCSLSSDGAKIVFSTTCQIILGNGITIRNLSFYTNVIDNDKYNVGLLSATSKNNITIDNCSFNGSYGCHLFFGNCNNVTVKNSFFTNSRYNSLFFLYNNNQIEVYSNRFVNNALATKIGFKAISFCTYWGYVGYVASNVLVQGNYIFNSGELAIEFWGGRLNGVSKNVNVISNNIVDTYSNVGDGFGISMNSCTQYLVSNNIVTSSNKINIALEAASCEDGVYVNNVTKSCNYGISISDNSTRINVLNNTFLDVKIRGIYASGGLFTLKGNYIESIANCIFLNGVTSASIMDNSLNTSNNGSAAILYHSDGEAIFKGNILNYGSSNDYPLQAVGTNSILRLGENENNGNGTVQTVADAVAVGYSQQLLAVNGTFNKTKKLDLFDQNEIPRTNLIKLGFNNPSVTKLRVKKNSSSGGQSPTQIKIRWWGRYDQSPRGGEFSLSFGSYDSYNEAPVFWQNGTTVTISSISYDTNGYPYWDITLPVNAGYQAVIELFGYGSTTNEYSVLGQ
jgi:hypothetical protein